MMSGYTDMHSHILPAVDDGAKDMAMTMKMIDTAYAQGVRTMIATPHYYPGHRNCSTDFLKNVYKETEAEIHSKYNDFKLLLGNEIYYKEEIIDRLKEKVIFTLADTRYILLEFPVLAEYKKLYEAVKKCVDAGFYPILAHIERYCCLTEESKVAELIRAGAYMQMNAENFRKGFFVQGKKYGMKLIQKGMVHFLGSDCHDTDSRKPDLGIAADYLKQKTENSVFQQLTEINTRMLLENKCI